MNAELFARAQGNVTLILGLLAPGNLNPHVRLGAVRLLAAIASQGTHRLPEVHEASSIAATPIQH